MGCRGEWTIRLVLEETKIESAYMHRQIQVAKRKKDKNEGTFEAYERRGKQVRLSKRTAVETAC